MIVKFFRQLIANRGISGYQTVDHISAALHQRDDRTFLGRLPLEEGAAPPARLGNEIRVAEISLVGLDNPTFSAHWAAVLVCHRFADAVRQ